MRALIFRAWNEKYKSMSETFTLQEAIDSDDFWGCGPSTTDECIFMQYTGARDKNSRMIFEGDIVKFDASYMPEDPPNYNYEIKLHDGAFVLGETDARVFHYPQTEIIGNVFENPELLMKGDK